MKQIWTGRAAQVVGRYGEHAPTATVCCNACRTCVTTNLLALLGGAVTWAGLGAVRLLGKGGRRPKGGSMVKITDKTDYSRFARPTSEDEGMWLDVEVHLVTHPVGQVREMHTHDPTPEA